ncbi:hypothetical protein Vretimale_11741 [Volvox reticuliferus]|uniref:Protein RFT1 homolog n=1 Tax=Volvox reticuliferus TaxID=1737510 RepID=A0A8J4GH63_9CHLO|nr:hypothetical protein Vretifemale_20251 [Volvox reticuliferus]GIM07662.1 hypothetical protein Vretimale_11741 [Volvox reticuliferus]
MAWSPVYPWRSHVHFSVVLPSPPHATTPQPIHDTLRPQLASVQFHLLTTTALFISREGFRRGCLRFGAAGVGAGGDNAETPDAKVKEANCRGDGDGNKSSSSRNGGAVSGGAGATGGINNRSVLRVAALAVPWGMVITAGVCGIALWQHTAATTASSGGSAQEPEVPYYREAIILHGMAAVLELLAEPFYILASVHLMFGSRVAVEFASTLTKSLVTLGLLSSRRLAHVLPPALIFSAAQLAMAAVVMAGYWAVGLRLMTAGGTEVPRRAARSKGGGDKSSRATRRPGSGSRSESNSWLSPWTPLELHVLATTAVFTLQAVEKLALAEGSKVVLATIQSAVNQGVYGLVSNLGSLVVRTLFQPLEEAAFAAFSTWGADAKASGAGAAATEGAGAELSPSAAVVAARLAPLARALSPMVKAVAVLGLLAAAFGPSYSYLLLRLVYGTRWSETEAPAVLAAYSVYVLLLAINGIGEAFVHAVLDARGLQQSNALLLVFSGAHLGVCVVLVRQYGALGLVAADGANMVLRISYSAWCIRRFFGPLPAFSLHRDLLPAPSALAAFTIAAAAAATSNRLLLAGAASMPQRIFLRRAASHVGVGVVLLAALLGLLVRTERAVLRQVLEMRRKWRERGGGPGGGGAGKSGKED